jgi:hypothetical protein
MSLEQDILLFFTDEQKISFLKDKAIFAEGSKAYRQAVFELVQKRGI